MDAPQHLFGAGKASPLQMAIGMPERNRTPHQPGSGRDEVVEALIEDARSEGFKIIPTCSYVAAQFDRHPEWADLRA